MMSENLIPLPEHDEARRRWALEKAIDFFAIAGTSGTLVALASEIDDFAKNGKKD